MTVKELIEELKAYPEGAKVWTRALPDGDDVEAAAVIGWKSENGGWWSDYDRAIEKSDSKHVLIVWEES